MTMAGANLYRVRLELVLRELIASEKYYRLYRTKYLPGMVLRPIELGETDTYMALVLDGRSESIANVLYDLDTEEFVVTLEPHISSDLDGYLGQFLHSGWRREMPKTNG